MPPLRETHLCREGIINPEKRCFILDCLRRRNKSGAPQPLIWGAGQWELMSQVMKEITVCHFNFLCLCTCVILYTSVQSCEILVSFLFRSEAQCSCGHTAHVHLRRSSNLKDKPSFLTTSVVSSPFPFCKLHNLSFEVLVTLPCLLFFFFFASHTVQLLLTFCGWIVHSIAFG